MNITLADTIVKGMNNPDCAFFVGQSLGYTTAGSLIFKVGLIYIALKALDKIIFTLIPKLYKKWRENK
jgi:hypothetical protein